MDHPDISLAYLRTITDHTGIIQHGFHSIPNRRLGYTTDDNSRALIVAVQNYEMTGKREDLDLAITYISYLHYAQNPDYKFKNVMNFEHEFLDAEGTQDCYGQTMWACGFAASSGLPENVRIVPRKMFQDGIVWVGDLDSPRAKSYSMLGMCGYLQGNEDKAGVKDKLDVLADSLVAAIRAYSEAAWHWYEAYLTYGNAILPLAMLSAAQITGKKEHMEAAVSTMNFLTETVIIDGRLEVIGNDGWYTRGSKRAWFDQQAVDAGYIVYLYARAYEALGDKSYLELARIAYSWFFGNNRSGVQVYDPITHGCYDAITPWGLNLNQGAESIVCFLLAQFAISKFNDQRG